MERLAQRLNLGASISAIVAAIAISSAVSLPAAAQTASSGDNSIETVTVTGKIELYRKVPEIKTTPADVTIVQPASTEKI